MFLQRHVFILRNHFPDHNYIYHDTELPLPAYVRAAKFDAIVLDVSLLGMRWANKEFFQGVLRDYAFVGMSNAVKLAFPQDEYDCHRILDDWMCDWRVDVLFSVLDSNWDVLYPKFHKLGKIRIGYTAYIDESLIDAPRLAFDKRQIDLGYRATKLPPYFGFIGEAKWAIGELVASKVRHTNLACDIVLGDAGLLRGQAWLDFLNNCRFTLGANSGSSLLDPFGDIQRSVKRYLKQHPSADFAEVEAHCFNGLDAQYVFTAISPRVLEAGLLETCQILVNGDYSRILKPWDHYIPIRSDASDFDVVVKAMGDRPLVDRLRQNCRAALLDFKPLRASIHARNILDVAIDLKTQKGILTNSTQFAKLVKRYEIDMAGLFRNHWKRQASKRQLSRVIKRSATLQWLVRTVRSAL